MAEEITPHGSGAEYGLYSVLDHGHRMTLCQESGTGPKLVPPIIIATCFEKTFKNLNLLLKNHRNLPLVGCSFDIRLSQDIRTAANAERPLVLEIPENRAVFSHR